MGMASSVGDWIALVIVETASSIASRSLGAWDYLG